MFKETFWEEEPFTTLEEPEKKKILEASYKQEQEQEIIRYEQFRKNREPFEWYCYEDNYNTA